MSFNFDLIKIPTLIKVNQDIIKIIIEVAFPHGVSWSSKQLNNRALDIQLISELPTPPTHKLQTWPFTIA